MPRRSALILVIGKRVGFKKDPMRPHNLPLVMLGAGLLWFGWFGFNAGSWLAADGVGRASRSSTPRSPPPPPCSAGSAYEKIRHGAFTTLGAASGAVAGLVAITPACGSVSPLGAIADRRRSPALLCAWAVGLKYKLGFDDSLDVVGVHLVGGIVGSLLIGFFATGGIGQTAPRACSTAAASTSWASRPSASSAVLAYSLVVSAAPGQGSST